MVTSTGFKKTTGSSRQKGGRIPWSLHFTYPEHVRCSGAQGEVRVKQLASKLPIPADVIRLILTWVKALNTGHFRRQSGERYLHMFNVTGYFTDPEGGFSHRVTDPRQDSLIRGRLQLTSRDKDPSAFHRPASLVDWLLSPVKMVYSPDSSRRTREFLGPGY